MASGDEKIQLKQQRAKINLQLRMRKYFSNEIETNQAARNDKKRLDSSNDELSNRFFYHFLRLDSSQFRC
jgi:hypothetical protein